MTQEEVDKKEDEFEKIFRTLKTGVIQKYGTPLTQGKIPNSRGANDIYAEVITSFHSHTSRGFPVSINDPASQKIITEQAPKINRALQKLMLHISSDLTEYGDGHSISSSDDSVAKANESVEQFMEKNTHLKTLQNLIKFNYQEIR